jgi:quinol monooxygenase YgiN
LSGVKYSAAIVPRNPEEIPVIHVLAIITAKPGQRAAVLEAFQANRPTVLAEAGCIEYGAAVDIEDMGTTHYGPDSFVVIEKWESPDHLKAHAAAPHMKAYGAKTKDMVASRAIHVLKPV